MTQAGGEVPVVFSNAAESSCGWMTASLFESIVFAISAPVSPEPSNQLVNCSFS